MAQTRADALDRDLRRRYGGGAAGLTYMRGAHADALRAAMRAADATAVFASERFEPAHVANDARVAAALARENLSVTLLPGHLLFDPRATEIDMGAEKYYFGTLMPYVHAAEKTGARPTVPRPAPPAAPLAGAADAASAARVAARLRAACEKRGRGASRWRPTWTRWACSPPPTRRSTGPAAYARRGISPRLARRRPGRTSAGANLARCEDGASFTEDDASAVARLSPYLRFGQISPRRVYHELSVAEKPTGSGSGLRNRRGSNASDKGPSTKTGRQLSRTRGAQAVPPRVRVLAARALAASDDALGARALRGPGGLAFGVDGGGRQTRRRAGGLLGV